MIHSEIVYGSRPHVRECGYAVIKSNIWCCTTFNWLVRWLELRFLVMDTQLYSLPCLSLGRSVGPSIPSLVTFFNSERFLHHYSCPTNRDWSAVYPAVFDFYRRFLQYCSCKNGWIAFFIKASVHPYDTTYPSLVITQATQIACGWAGAVIKKKRIIQAFGHRTSKLRGSGGKFKR